MWKSNASASFGVWFLRPINGDSAWGGEAKACLDLKQHLLGGKSSKCDFGGFGQRPVKTAQCLDYNFAAKYLGGFHAFKRFLSSSKTEVLRSLKIGISSPWSHAGAAHFVAGSRAWGGKSTTNSQSFDPNHQPLGWEWFEKTQRYLGVYHRYWGCRKLDALENICDESHWPLRSLKKVSDKISEPVGFIKLWHFSGISTPPNLGLWHRPPKLASSSLPRQVDRLRRRVHNAIEELCHGKLTTCRSFPRQTRRFTGGYSHC